MPVFDTICMSLGAAGTGGFACRNSGQAGYTVYQQAVLSIAMILFGINFNVYYLLLIRKPKEAFKCEEMRGYLAIILIAVVLITVNIRSMFPSFSWLPITHYSRLLLLLQLQVIPLWILINGRNFQNALSYC